MTRVRNSKPQARRSMTGPSKKVSTFKRATSVRAPIAINRSSRQSGRNSLRFKESERIATVPGSVAFSTINTVSVNPGLTSSFPWLSGHAALYDNYVIHKLVYRYKNLKGTASNGNILMSFDYDALDGAPATGIAVTQSTCYQDGSPWRIFELQVPSDKRILFTRTSIIPGSDLKTYDLGKLHISAEGCADDSDHGYIEVDYDVELFNKHSSSTTSGPATSNAFAQYLLPDSNLTQNSDTLLFPAVANSGGISGMSSDGNGTFTLPEGFYAVHVTAESNGSCRLSFNGTATGTALIGEQTTTAVNSTKIHRPFGIVESPAAGSTVYVTAVAQFSVRRQCEILFTKLA